MTETLPLIAGNFTIVGFIIGLTQITKAYLPLKFQPLLPLVWGLVIGGIGFWYASDALWVVYGVAAALQASGAYSITKNTAERI